MKDISSELKLFKDKSLRVRIQKESLDKRINSVQESLDKEKYNVSLFQKASEIFKVWLEDFLKHNVDSISDLVTTGLQAVIDDQNLRFKIIQELKHNRLSMRFVVEEDGVEANPMDSFGGGTVLMASFILRLAIMTRMQMGNLLLLDESLSALAVQYIPNAADFMKKLSEEMGINILMVTHNEEFMSNSHTAYEAYTTRDSEGMKILQMKLRNV